MISVYIDTNSGVAEIEFKLDGFYVDEKRGVLSLYERVEVSGGAYQTKERAIVNLACLLYVTRDENHEES